MNNVIRTQAIRIVILFAGLAAICVWQSHFLLSGIAANPYLNLLIISVFVFGSALAIIGLWSLRNDIAAYRALQLVYEDAKARPFEDLTDEELRERCLRPGIVYRNSQLLGPVFDLTLDELHRSRNMRISVTTMQNLISAIDGRIAHQRSLIMYLTNLCIFLGLIGTFIGLMEMVASVGGIIGGLAGSSSPGGDAMRALLKQLEAPLTGMAQGFSASLFGLGGSLSLSLIARFLNLATHSVREEFEGWLAGVAQIESGGDMPSASRMAGAQAGAVAAAAAPGLSALLQRIGATLRGASERMEHQTEVLERACRQMDRAARTEQQALAALGQVERLSEEIAALRDDATRNVEGLRFGMLDAFERLSRSMQEQAAHFNAEMARVTATQGLSHAAIEQATAAQDRLARGIHDQQNALQMQVAALAADQSATGVALTQMVEAQERHVQDLQDKSRHILGEVSKVSAAQGALDAALGQTAAAQERLARLNMEELSATRHQIAEVHSGQAHWQQSFERLSERQNEILRVGEEQSARTDVELSRLRSQQSHAESLLTQIATVQAAQPEHGTVTSIVTQSLTAAVGEIARAMDQTMRTLTHEIAHLGDEQRRTTEAMSRGPDTELLREIGDMGRAVQKGIDKGLLEVAQTLDAALAAYATTLHELAIERDEDDRTTAIERRRAR